MDIVRADVAQLPVATELLQEYYAAIGVVVRDDAADVEHYLHDAACGLWIAFVAGEPAGCVVLRPLPQRARAAECKRLYVRPAFRGQGLAAALLDAMEDFARSQSLQSIFLDSKDDLQDAIRLYRGRQYEPCERYNSNPQATIFLCKQL